LVPRHYPKELKMYERLKCGAYCFFVASLTVTFLGGCASTQKRESGSGAAERSTGQPGSSTHTRYPRLTVNSGDYQNLGELVRAIGEKDNGGGIALVSGLEERPATGVKVNRAAYIKGITQIVGPELNRVHDSGSYVFVYPAGYEILLNISLQEQLRPQDGALRASFAVGAGTDMFNALALLSEALGVTILADNEISDTRCGEVFLHDAPAATILEAILRSARLLPDAFVVERAESYVFIRSAANRSTHDRAIDRDSFPESLRTELVREFDVRLPGRDGPLQFQKGAMPLSEVLGDLSTQLGVPVSAEPALLDFPVNQAAFLGLSGFDVLNLIARQWPVARYGYRNVGPGIQFCASSFGEERRLEDKP
jgi:hypothetical protein